MSELTIEELREKYDTKPKTEEEHTAEARAEIKKCVDAYKKGMMYIPPTLYWLFENEIEDEG